eukprot:CAMPEP_0170093870 /NCGR_PEP_ID=MMETSP0019_2-20121128/26816_1 /TAXON_ID=98059 /ORGANISM="Dinobryon sp., Strain UTEXLB2267" /LENGTH=373 /DNA_ID=CAMNT_0010314889 /DNA_START=90 /DNA_END=1208 /DNA_ORIENTATION=-
MKQARYDKLCISNPQRVARFELQQRMQELVNVHCISDRLRNYFENKSTDDLDIGGCQELHELKSWGLPDRVISRYETAGVKSLFTWQVECLLTALLPAPSESPRTETNLIYSAPTSGGKTLVAEILMLKRLAERKGTVFFVVPFVALAEEKLAYLQDMWQDMTIGVRAFHGEEGHALTGDVDVAVCTIERANILLTQLYDEGRAEQLSMVVVDEIHMLADCHRGFLLEVLLSKILHSAPGVQLVGMSATLPNIADLSHWLSAELYVTAYRPVRLEVRVCVDRALYAVSGPARQEPGTDLAPCLRRVLGAAAAPHRSVQEPGQACSPSLQQVRQLGPPQRADPDGLRQLCAETVRGGKSVLLFCDSKRRCEVCA